MKKSALEDQLSALHALRTAPLTADTLAQLRQALANHNSHVVAAAAEIVGEEELADLEPDLTAAFAALMRNPAKTDPGCGAKTAIANALRACECPAEAVFLQGVRHVQMEPVWGGQVDTAAPLRGACALGLVGMRSPHALLELAHLLADPESDARISAARALAYSADPASVPLLHFKVLTGDTHAAVLYECFLALLKLDVDTSLPFVAGYLNNADPAIAESAALALGESRQEGAFAVLRDAWENTFDAERRRTLLLALATLRSEPALDYLLDIIRDEARVHADAALEALHMYRRDETIWRRVEKVLAARPPD
ncbi:MAG TPA: HEAT repeat domain-containing protein [Anaerolineae bacterium]|nr:HEAT repeat domain-containing protein [Anaerolineae bacterium]HQI86857.1 HEAT repeat domain-containing protein [Anaerolineae bacterium]